MSLRSSPIDVVPWFGVVRGEVLETSEVPTLVHGPVANEVVDILRELGLHTKVVEDKALFREAQYVKTMWASTMWLLCHAKGGCTIGDLDDNDVKDLVEELYSVLDLRRYDYSDILDQFYAYNDVMPKVTPSFELAMKEIDDRNMIFLKDGKGNQIKHRHLLREVGLEV